jgi:hypothetical protein
MSEKMLWIKSSADFASVNNVSRETIASKKIKSSGILEYWNDGIMGSGKMDEAETHTSK